MFLLNFYRYLLGYVEILIYGDFPERLLNLMAKNGIVPWNIIRTKENIRVCLKNSDFLRIRKIRAQSKVKVKIIKKSGLKLKMRRFKLRYGIMAGFIVFLAMQIFLSRFVWQIDVAGNNAVSEREVLAYCEHLGIKRGRLKSKLDLPVLKEKLLLSLPKTAWASINLEGCKITVNISEIKNEGIVSVPSNIVSDYDCVIKDIRVISGLGVVKKGQAVQKGDLLISGVSDIGAGAKFVTAKGEIIAEIEKKYVFSEPFIKTERKYTGKKKEKNVLEFFSLKIPLYLGEYPPCADTETTVEYLQFLGSKTPIILHKKSFRFFENNQVKHTEEELIKIMENRFKETVKKEKIEDYELVSYNVITDKDTVRSEYTLKFEKNIGISENLLF